MSSLIKLQYEDDEGLRVEIHEEGMTPSGIPMAVLTVYKDGVSLFDAELLDLKDAQMLAHLLVGIEIQEDGAAWKRGPRGPAVYS